jgi:hypothetical protein
MVGLALVMAPTAAAAYLVVPTSGRPGDLLVQGGSLRTWSYRSPAVEQVQVVLHTEGRPLDADIELWQGPDNIPVKLRVFCDDGFLRPFSAVLATPRGPNTVSVRNIGQLEFPLVADIFPANDVVPSPDTAECFEIIQGARHLFECAFASCLAPHGVAGSPTAAGGALRTYPFHPAVDCVEVLLRTDGRPLNARIELLQGPNNNKQVLELYTDDGLYRPFLCFLESAELPSVVRVVNTAPVEFPLYASVGPHAVGEGGWMWRGGWAHGGMGGGFWGDEVPPSGGGMLDGAMVDGAMMGDVGVYQGGAGGGEGGGGVGGGGVGGGGVGGGGTATASAAGVATSSVAAGSSASSSSSVSSDSAVIELMEVLRSEFRFEPAVSWTDMVQQAEQRLFGAVREGTLKERARRCVEMLR